MGEFVNKAVTEQDALLLDTLQYMEIIILFQKRFKPIILVSRATLAAGVMHRRQWVGDIQILCVFVNKTVTKQDAL